MLENQNLKKEGLLLIIDSYLSQSTPEALLFLDKHIASTEDLTQSLGSHTEWGLTVDQLLLNQELYGKNSGQTDELSCFQRFCKIFTEQIFKLRTGFILLAVLFEVVCAHVWEIYELQLASLTVLVALGISWTTKIGLFLRQKLIVEERINIKEPSTVYVYRQGSKLAVPEEQLTVGDLIFIDYNQIVPATGLLISRQEIELDESKYGKGLQTKLPLENCLEMLAQKNELQLRMDVESGALGSPIVLRGSVNNTGKTFKMLILAVDQQTILQKHEVETSKEKDFSTIELWISNITQFVSKITSVVLTIIALFHALSLIFKIRGLPSGQFIPFASTIVENTQSVICLLLLTDSSLLKLLLRGSYLQVVGLLGARQNIDRFLSVEQLFLTEQSICKYDEVSIKKLVLIDIQEPIEFQLVPALQPDEPYYLLHEILAGVNLDKDLPAPKQSKVHKNTIIHLLGLQERVFSSLYSALPSRLAQGKVEEQNQDSSDVLKTQDLLVRKRSSPNRVNPGRHLERNRIESIQYNLPERPHGNSKSMTEVKLDEYLSKHCHFSTQNIVEGIKKLAKNISRTYFFQKFSLEKLSQIKKIWSEGNFISTDIEKQEKILHSIKRLQKQGLTPYLVGFDEGAFSKKYMNYLLGVVGVETNYDKEIVVKMQQLQQIGVRTLFTIKEYEQKLTETHKMVIQKQFLERKWALPEHQFVDIDKIKSCGGRLICIQCLTSKCKCRCRKEELANPQGFLEAISNVRCVWGVGEKDLTYLERGFEQLSLATLSLTDHYEDIPRKMDQIIVGNQLFYALEQNLALWLAWISSVVLCLFPFNYLTFDHILSHPQLYVFLVVFQILMIKHQICGSASLITSKNLTLSKRRKQMLGLALKIDIIVFVTCLTTCSFITLSHPEWFYGNTPKEGISGYSCQLVRSYYHNPQIAKAICANQGQTIILFSKAGTFIYLLIMLSFVFRSAITIRQPFSKSNIIFHTLLIGLILLLVYLYPEYLQVSLSGLQLQELGICFGVALGTVCLGLLARAIILMTGLGKIFHFEIRIGERGNHYTDLLKEFRTCQTMMFPLQKEQCSM